MNELPTLEYLKECFEYFPDSGKLVWSHRPENHFVSSREHKRYCSTRLGKEAGRIRFDGYLELRLDYVYYGVHRIVYKLMTGEEPENFIDHINGDKSDNRWDNLREATSTQNNHNRKISKNNTTGYKGVSWNSHFGKYKSSIRVGEGRRIFLGYFDSLEEAKDSYNKAADQHHKEYKNYG